MIWGEPEAIKGRKRGEEEDVKFEAPHVNTQQKNRTERENCLPITEARG